MSEPPPKLPNTRLTRGWLRTLQQEVLQQRARRRRILIVVLSFATIDVLIIFAVLLALGGSGGGSHRAAKPALVHLPAFVTGGVRRALGPTFVAAARESHVPAALVMAVGWRESEWEESLVSGVGAVGIGQLLPATSTFVANQLLHDPNLDPHRADDNVRMTARYLRELIQELGGQERLGVGAYLQGSTSVRISGLTSETTAYVDQVEALKRQFAAAAG